MHIAATVWTGIATEDRNPVARFARIAMVTDGVELACAVSAVLEPRQS
jgi:hypothetical protein